MTKKLFVRSATPADEDAIVDYYETHKTRYVSGRPRDLWRERLAAGAATLIEDEQKNIVAAAFVYPVMKQTDQGEVHAWSEVGSVLVAMKGSGLFAPLVATTILRAYLLEPPEDRFILDIVEGNGHSRHAFTKAGARLYGDMPENLKNKVKATLIRDDDAKFDWYHIGVELMPGFARQVLKSVDNPAIVNRSTQERFELDFSKCTLVTMFRSAVEEVARADFGNALQPDMSKGINHYKKLKP